MSKLLKKGFIIFSVFLIINYISYGFIICLVNVIELDEINKLVVFLAALFHDIAKPICTSLVDGEIRSFRHPKKGALITRKYLWKDLGLSGVKEYQEVREAIALLVKYHPEPTYLDYEKDKSFIERDRFVCCSFCSSAEFFCC